MSNLIKYVNLQYSLHEFALQNEHGVRRITDDSSWKIFKPTGFIYAFFVFNSIYSINWKASVVSSDVIEWNTEKHSDKDRLTEPQKISRLLSFCFDCLDIQATCYYHEKLIKYIGDTIIPLEELKFITDDFRTRNRKKSFLKCFADVYNQANLSQGSKKKALNTVLYFVYLVRCNIFHGTKSSVEMLDEGQQKRLNIYTAILLAANDMLFRSLCEILDQQPILKRNINAGDI